MELTPQQEDSLQKIFPQSKRTNSNITVTALSTYSAVVDSIAKELSTFHSINGKAIEGVKEGDFIKFTLPETPYNTVQSVQQSLKEFNNHPAYSIDNVKEQPIVPKFNTDSIKSIRDNFHKSSENSHTLKV